MLVPTPGHTAGRMALLVRAGVDEIAGEQVGAVIRRITEKAPKSPREGDRDRDHEQKRADTRGESLAELVDEAARERLEAGGGSFPSVLDDAARVGGRIPQTFSVYGPKNAR